MLKITPVATPEIHPPETAPYRAQNKMASTAAMRPSEIPAKEMLENASSKIQPVMAMQAISCWLKVVIPREPAESVIVRLKK